MSLLNGVCFAQNFLASIFEAQYGRKMALQDGSATQLGDMMDDLNLFFTAYFAVELGINMYAHWFSLFAYNGWNHLDVFIVLTSLVDLGPIDIPNWFVQLMRAFRVIRLFGRIRALKKMIAAVTASIFPMMNAFIILMIFLSICKLDLGFGAIGRWDSFLLLCIVPCSRSKDAPSL